VHLVPVDTYLTFGNGKKRPADEGNGTFNVFGSNGVIGHCDEFNNPAGTIIIGRVGSYCGSVHYSPEQCWVTDNAIKGNTKTGADARYCYYLLLTKDLHALRGGSGQPLINQTSLKSLEVPERSFADQKAIAHILGTLDDKIELNQKMNQTLEGIAKAIFKSWFVDFDPVRAKAEGRPTGLPPEISDLFPDELVDSEIGEIPKGWVVTPLSECAIEIESGRRPKGGIDKSLRQGIPSVGAESIAPAGEFDFSKVKYVTADFAEKMKKGRVQNFDVALYKDGGKPGQFIPRVGIYGNGFPFEHFYVNEHVFLLRSEQLGQSLLYRLISSRAFLDQLIAKGSAKAAQPGLNQTEVVESTFVRPSRDALAAFNDKTRPLLKRQFLLGKENETLSELRDTLLPKLISGELRIPDAEKFLEEAGI
jgi:type I restriction enzyme S subunit